MNDFDGDLSGEEMLCHPETVVMCVLLGPHVHFLLQNMLLIKSLILAYSYLFEELSFGTIHASRNAD